MNIHADKTQKNKSQSVALGVSKNQSNRASAFQFVDNRPEAIVQIKLQAMANNSIQTKQLMAFQEIANRSPQAKKASQLQAIADNHYTTQSQQPIQQKSQTQADSSGENKTGLPDNLKAGVENLSGISLDDVKVHYNSSQPAQLNALAYAQGTDIHVASGQEKHLPHEAWHVVQQAQGRVKPTMQMKDGVPINDDKGLEHEADVMGAKALGGAVRTEPIAQFQRSLNQSLPVVQRAIPPDAHTESINTATGHTQERHIAGGTGNTPGKSTFDGDWSVVEPIISGASTTQANWQPGK